MSAFSIRSLSVALLIMAFWVGIMGIVTFALPALAAECGDSICDPGEAGVSGSCQSDCPGRGGCGDGTCNGSETTATCATDCPVTGGGGGGHTCPDGSTGLCNPLSFDTLAEFLQAILDAVVLIAFPFIVLFLVYAGFKFVLAQGKPEEISKARTTLIWTLIGAVLVLGAKALSMAIEATVATLR